jgi:hypothetical protein
MKNKNGGFILLGKLLIVSAVMAIVSLNGARIKARDASFKSSVASIQAVGILCCDMGKLNEVVAPGGKICSSSGVMGNYPKDLGTINVTKQCDGGHFSIKILAPNDFGGSVVSGTCTETNCTFN